MSKCEVIIVEGIVDFKRAMNNFIKDKKVISMSLNTDIKNFSTWYTACIIYEE